MKISVLAICLLVLLSNSALAATVVLGWEDPGDVNITGYKVYYGTQQSPPYLGTGCPQGNSPIDVGNVLTTTLTGLTNGVPYYFTVTAYGTFDEGLYSNIVSVIVITPGGAGVNSHGGNITKSGTGTKALQGKQMVSSARALTMSVADNVTLEEVGLTSVAGSLDVPGSFAEPLLRSASVMSAAGGIDASGSDDLTISGALLTSFVDGVFMEALYMPVAGTIVLTSGADKPSVTAVGSFDLSGAELAGSAGSLTRTISGTAGLIDKHGRPIVLHGRHGNVINIH